VLPPPPTSPALSDERIEEGRFAELLEQHSATFFRLGATLEQIQEENWTKPHVARLVHECHTLESFLDDHGARLNRRFCTLTELVASLRSFALAGYSLLHLRGRLPTYGLEDWADSTGPLRRNLDEACGFLIRSTIILLRATRARAGGCGIEPAGVPFPSAEFAPTAVRLRLPHDIGQDQLDDERRRVAEVVSKFLQASDVLADLGVRPIADATVRRAFLAKHCSEEQARVYEATVHNLQSTYDTYIKNTVLEGNDPRLRQLRGHASAALHLLEAVTHLTHFYERHESELRTELTERILAELVQPTAVQEVILNNLLVNASDVLQAGRHLSEAVLPSYTRVRELEVQLPAGVTLHARPVALIVGIVNHFGTPVEFEIGSRRCNAASILEVLMAVGSTPEVAGFVFRGDERPLTHIALLFEHGLGERGTDGLPEDLSYLRPSSRNSDRRSR
jgi:phosphotransferase system HPr-like phosphotransfer protein